MEPRRLYGLLREGSHWQLRSLVSSPEPNLVYYPSGRDIYRLNTKTREREILSTLPFSPKCLTASREWLCCGGEAGQFVTLYLKEQELEEESQSSSDPDARLPLDLDPSHRIGTVRESGTARSPRPAVPLTPGIYKMGNDIVNCTTIWSPWKGSSARAYGKTVAVVSSNDCTVSILDIENQETIEKLTFPECVNRSVMSPDGEFLVTICDDPFLYIHKRKSKVKSKEQPPASTDHLCEWNLAQRIQLEGQRSSDKSDMRGSFALCFSNSGKYLAVATQYGIISIFDAERLTDFQSLVVVFTTSRPGPDPDTGPVRAMEFSPAPFDLLAWTESTGRVGVADVRSLFNSRQLIMIDRNHENVERVNISERLIEGRLDPRLRTLRSRSPSTTPDYLGLDLERRQLRLLARNSERHHAPLTSEDLEVLQAHRIARRDRDAANAAREALAEAAGSSHWAWDENHRPTASTSDNSSRMSTTGLPAALREFVNPDRTAASFRTFITERNRENERRRIRATVPHRDPVRGPTLAEVAAYDEAVREAREAQERLSGLSTTTTTTAEALFRLEQLAIGPSSRAPTLPPLRQQTHTPTSDPPTSSEALSHLEQLARAPGHLQTSGLVYEPSTTAQRERQSRPPLSPINPDAPSNTESPWAEIDALYRSRFPLSADRALSPALPADVRSAVDRANRMRVEIEGEDNDRERERERAEREQRVERERDRDRRDFAMRLRQPWRPLEETVTGAGFVGADDAGYSRRTGAVRTMGLAWSVDGTIL